MRSGFAGSPTPRTVSTGETVVNLSLYQLGWSASVFGAAGGLPWYGAFGALLLVWVHLAMVRDRYRELLLVGLTGALGLAVDSIQLWLGVFDYPGGTPVAWLAPPWIVVLWLQFATLFHFALGWLSERYLLAAALGLAGAPLSFWAGARSGAIDFPSPYGYLALGLAWSLALPLLVWAADRLRLRPGGYRWRAPVREDAGR